MKKPEDAVRLFAICFLLFRDALRLAIPDNSTIGNYTSPVVFPGFLPNWPQPPLPEVGLAAAVPFVSTHDFYSKDKLFLRAEL